MKKLVKICAVVIGLMLFTGFGIYAATQPKSFLATSTVYFNASKNAYVKIDGQFHLSNTIATWNDQASSLQASKSTQNYVKDDESGAITAGSDLENWDSTNDNLLFTFDNDNTVVTALIRLHNPTASTTLYIGTSIVESLTKVDITSKYRVVEDSENFADLVTPLVLEAGKTIEFRCVLTLQADYIQDLAAQPIAITFDIDTQNPA